MVASVAALAAYLALAALAPRERRPKPCLNSQPAAQLRPNPIYLSPLILTLDEAVGHTQNGQHETADCAKLADTKQTRTTLNGRRLIPTPLAIWSVKLVYILSLPLTHPSTRSLARSLAYTRTLIHLSSQVNLCDERVYNLSEFARPLLVVWTS